MLNARAFNISVSIHMLCCSFFDSFLGFPADDTRLPFLALFKEPLETSGAAAVASGSSGGELGGEPSFLFKGESNILSACRGETDDRLVSAARDRLDNLVGRLGSSPSSSESTTARFLTGRWERGSGAEGKPSGSSSSSGSEEDSNVVTAFRDR